PSPAAKVAHPPPAEPSLGQAAPPKGSSIASRLVGVVTKNKMPAAQKPAFKFDPEPQAKVEAETPPVIEPETTSTAEAPVDQPFAPDVGQEVAALAASETGETASSRSNIFESPVDDEMDQLFSKLAPAEAQQQVVSGPHAVVEAKGQGGEGAPQAVKGGADFTVHTPEAEGLDEAVVPSYQDVEQRYEAEAKATGVQAQSAADHLFGPELDNEIDEIFSTLAPADAQREVVHPHEEAEPVEAFEQEEEFAGKPLVPQVEMSATPAQEG